MTRAARGLRDLLASLDLCEPDCELVIDRLRPGHWQRSAGAWSWEAMRIEDGRRVPLVRGCSVGSQWSVREVLAASSVSAVDSSGGDVAIVPEFEGVPCASS